MQGSQTLGKTKKSKNAQRHSAGNIDYDNISGSQEADDPPPVPQSGFRIRSKTVGDSSEPPKPPIRTSTLSSSHTTHQQDHEKLDPGTKSEGEEDSQQGTMPKSKATLGRTPNHLTLR